MIAVIAVPILAAFILSFAMFKRRVGGVYFAIITQAFAAVLTILIVGRQGYTGGINGITDLRTMLGWDIRTDHAKYILYFACCALLIGSMLLSRFVLRSKLGRLLVAIRDKEDRVRFSGYDVANFKVFIFCLASAIAAVGGALFTLQVGFMSPSFVGIVPSIEMVIFCAVGGRQSIVGAVVGTLVVNWAKTSFSESFPELWLFAMGGLFIAVVLGISARPCRPFHRPGDAVAKQTEKRAGRFAGGQPITGRVRGSRHVQQHGLSPCTRGRHRFV